MALTQLRQPLNYCTIEDVENLLLIDINDTFSPQINNWISISEDEVNKYLGFTTASGIFSESIVDEVSDTGVVDSNLDLNIFTRKHPVQSVSNIQLIKGTTYVTLSLVDGVTPRYHIPNSREKIVYPQGSIATSGGNMALGGFASLRWGSWYTKISYIAGYDVIPGPISQATALLVADKVMRQSNKEGLQTLIQGRITKQWFHQRQDNSNSDLVMDAHAMLDPYRVASRWLRG